MEKITSTFEKLVPFIKDSTVLKIWKFLNQLIFILTNLFALYSFFVLFLYETISGAKENADEWGGSFTEELGHAFSNLNDEDFSYAIGPIIILILINISFKINKMMIKKLQE
tara:strand:+ start:188 stop:523 length:336 start_codon:yes stop_codon:yes gene_type:complete